MCFHDERTILTWVTMWLRGASATPNLSRLTKFENPDVGTARQTEEHVLTGHASFRSWCAACVQGRGRAERHQGEGRKELEDGLKIPVVSWDYCSLEPRIESVKLRWNSVETVQSW